MAPKPVSIDKARYELKRAADKMIADEERAAESRARWEAWVLDAYASTLTYNEIAEISQRSRPRIDQVLRMERIRRGHKVGGEQSKSNGKKA